MKHAPFCRHVLVLGRRHWKCDDRPARTTITPTPSQHWKCDDRAASQDGHHPKAVTSTGLMLLPMSRWLASRAKKEEHLCLIQTLVVVAFGSWDVDSVTSLASFGSLNLTGLLSHCRSCPSETKFGHLSGAWIAVGIQIERGPPWSMPKSYCSSASCLSSHAISAGTWRENQRDILEPSPNCQRNKLAVNYPACANDLWRTNSRNGHILPKWAPCRPQLHCFLSCDKLASPWFLDQQCTTCTIALLQNVNTWHLVENWILHLPKQNCETKRDHYQRAMRSLPQIFWKWCAPNKSANISTVPDERHTTIDGSTRIDGKLSVLTYCDNSFMTFNCLLWQHLTPVAQLPTFSFRLVYQIRSGWLKQELTCSI